MPAPLKFYHITDLHHYAPSLGIQGEAFSKLSHREQKCLAETGAIIDSAFETVINDSETDIVLIGGDVSYYGAMESHLDLIPKLKRLKDAGKKVFLITATHDYNQHPERCNGNLLVDATPTDRDALREIYYDYGFCDAYSEHRESMSYAVQLCEGYRLLCLNDDGDGIFCGYSESQLQWIQDMIAQAKADKQYIFIMTHHPCLPPFALYPMFSKRDMLGDWENTTDMLADAGIQVVFTGHTHMQNIAVKTTEKGNTIYDVNTASVVGYPAVMRKVTIDDKKIDVKSVTIDDFDWDRGGLSVEEYMKKNFLYFLNDIIDSAANDIDHLADLGSGFSMTPQQIYKLKIPVQIVGKKLHTWTLGRLGRFLHVSKSIDESVKDILLKDLFLELIQNIYYGDEPYTPDTAEYKAMDAILGKIKKYMSHFKKAQGAIPYLDLTKLSLYDALPQDWNFSFERREQI